MFPVLKALEPAQSKGLPDDLRSELRNAVIALDVKDLGRLPTFPAAAIGADLVWRGDRLI